jgi:GST-like protein
MDGRAKHDHDELRESRVNQYHLIASKSAGSMIVEAALALSKLPYEVEMIPYVEPGPQRERLLALNPLGQVPTLLLPDGRVMTQSAAIVLHLADEAPQAGLTPPAYDAARPMFLRWLLFIVSALYPTFTYGDDPSRWAHDEVAGKHLRQATDEHRKELWRYFAAQNPCKPWVLGERFSALDLYVAVMNMWRPGPAWFSEECPALAGIADRVVQMDVLRDVWTRNVD